MSDESDWVAAIATTGATIVSVVATLIAAKSASASEASAGVAEKALHIQLSTLSTIELTAAQVLAEGMESQQPYKDIYKTLKAALDGFAVGRAKILKG